MVCDVSKWGPCCLSSFCVLYSMVCDVSKWGPCCLSSCCVLYSMVCVVSKSVLFISVLCPVLNGV